MKFYLVAVDDNGMEDPSGGVEVSDVEMRALRNLINLSVDPDTNELAERLDKYLGDCSFA